MSTLQALDQEIRTRYAKRTGSLERFLSEWLKLDESQLKLFGSRGEKGENFFQYQLAKGDIEMGLALANIFKEFAESTVSEKVYEHLKHHDGELNDIWHYLANTLAKNETENGLTIAKLLIQLEVDYCRKNNQDESALAKLLLPEVKWKSINSMNAAKELTLAEMEQALPDRIKGNEQIKQEVFYTIFDSDLTNNEGLLSQIALRQGMAPQAERELRNHTERLFFSFVGGQRRESLFMRIAELDMPRLFEGIIEMLLRVTEDEVREIAARDPGLAKAEQQVRIYKRLAFRNRSFQSALTKAVIANRAKAVGIICGLLKNENLVATSKDTRGQTVKKDITVDEKSPAPQNASLSLLLQQDARGNTVFHTAVMLSRTECVKRLFNGLSLMDAFMICSRIPNRYGIVVADLLQLQRTMQKLAVEVKAGKLTEADANQIAGFSKGMNAETREFVGDLIKRAKETFERTGGLSEAKPTFDIRRVPTVALQIREQMKAKMALAPAGAGAGAA
ncbi:MAG: hypothetical protein JNK11_21090 [Alphaproteobacteria bacterium]|nr:hypothetical protein [Alphaproteobacteria bacterium]